MITRHNPDSTTIVNFGGVSLELGMLSLAMQYAGKHGNLDIIELSDETVVCADTINTLDDPTPYVPQITITLSGETPKEFTYDHSHYPSQHTKGKWWTRCVLGGVAFDSPLW